MSFSMHMIQGYIANMTGALTRVAIGWVPDFILAINATNPSGHIWFKSLGDGYGIQIATDGTISVVASACFSAFRGSNTVVHSSTFPVVDKDGTALANGIQAPDGFTMGTDAVLNTANDDLHFIAMRGVPYAAPGASDLEAPPGTAFSYTDEDA